MREAEASTSTGQIISDFFASPVNVFGEGAFRHTTILARFSRAVLSLAMLAPAFLYSSSLKPANTPAPCSQITQNLV